MFQAEDCIRDWSVTGVQTCALLCQAEDGIRDWSVTGVQTCALSIQAEDGIRDWSVTGVQTCALPICEGRRRFVGEGCTAFHSLAPWRRGWGEGDRAILVLQ